VLVVPGNHDSRNVGYAHFERLFATRETVIRKNGVTIVGVDSTEPDLDYGRIGRHRYPWIREAFMEGPDDFKVFVLHHHLLPIPGTGRERNIVNDAGDVLEVLLECGVELVLSGHKHVPYAWRLENMHVVNAGTVATLRLRGDTKPCYNVVEIRDCHVTVSRRYPFHGGETIVEFERSSG
jgi:3',5'-cyclic AMP phosphodiesterase CpdA